MSTYTLNPGEIAAHAKTLTAATADTVTFSDPFEQVEVITSGSADVYFTVDGSTATVAGAHTRRVPASTSPTAPSRVSTANGDGTQVSLISSGTPSYSVQRVK